MRLTQTGEWTRHLQSNQDCQYLSPTPLPIYCSAAGPVSCALITGHVPPSTHSDSPLLHHCTVTLPRFFPPMPALPCRCYGLAWVFFLVAVSCRSCSSHAPNKDMLKKPTPLEHRVPGLFKSFLFFAGWQQNGGLVTRWCCSWFLGGGASCDCDSNRLAHKHSINDAHVQQDSWRSPL